MERPQKKYRFLPLLPFGICSKQALCLMIRIPDISYLPYSPDIPMSERERQFRCASISIGSTVMRMLKTGYIEEEIRKYGERKSETYRAISLTKAGLYLLCGYPNDDNETERLSGLGEMSFKQMAALTFTRFNPDEEALRQMNMVRQTEPNLPREMRDQIDTSFLDALDTGELTILAYDNVNAPHVNTANPRYNMKRDYRNWRLSNIAALFIANNYLTYIDRRPMDTQWSVGAVYDEESYDRYLENGELDVPAFVYRSLSRWYTDHPESNRFMDPVPETTSQEEWSRTPAFYSTIEIPGFYTNNDDITAGQKNKVVHTLAGVAVGSKIAYIVHHTRHKKTPWGSRWERTTMEIVQAALEEANIIAPSGEPYRIREAIVVCGSISQFENFFNSARDNIAKRWQKDRKIGVPYDTVCLVPVNASGTMQIRYLMALSPYEMDMNIANNLVRSDARFTRNHGGLFMLSFDGTPVLLAHSMQLQQLYDAQQKYLEGMDFYVSCYPGQTQYIRRLMPNAKFI